LQDTAEENDEAYKASRKYSNTATADGTVFAKSKKTYSQIAMQKWNILRFEVKNKKHRGLEISKSGMSLKISKAKGEKHKGDELILTNMCFSHGVHTWEITATIACINLQVGVYNPI
jgi:arginyl-tRNA--protein-N-Asp/Glu arginylyltransferase